jgi:hypothetical protein
MKRYLQISPTFELISWIFGTMRIPLYVDNNAWVDEGILVHKQQRRLPNQIPLCISLHSQNLFFAHASLRLAVQLNTS